MTSQEKEPLPALLLNASSGDGAVKFVAETNGGIVGSAV